MFKQSLKERNREMGEGGREERSEGGQKTGHNSHNQKKKKIKWHCLFPESPLKNPLLKSSNDLHIGRFTYIFFPVRAHSRSGGCWGRLIWLCLPSLQSHTLPLVPLALLPCYHKQVGWIPWNCQHSTILPFQNNTFIWFQIPWFSTGGDFGSQGTLANAWRHF